MKKFRFPLKSVATVRSMAELRARERFSQAVQVYVAAQDRLTAIRTRLREYEEIMRSARSGAFRGADQASALVAFKEETINATKTEGEVTAARQALETARQAWLESRRDVRVIENLEVKARQVHARELEREFQAAMDDRASALAARQSAAQST